MVLGSLLVYGSLDFPVWGDPGSPASGSVSVYYIEQSMPETAVPNMVTAVLADFRGYDTLFETVVIFTAGIACLFLLRSFKPVAPKSRLFRHIPTGITLRIKEGGKLPKDSDLFERIDSVWIPHDLIVRTTARLIIPFIQIFALYVIAHGHHSPGGGFQGGVILGASLVLYAISFNLRSAIRQIGETLTVVFCALGVFIYAGTGILSLFFSANYLDYSALAPLLGMDHLDPALARPHGILIVETGVGMAVMGVMTMLYYTLSSAGKYDEGL